MRKYLVVLATATLIGPAADVMAQSSSTPSRGYVTFGGGYQAASGDLTDSLERSRYGETERIGVTNTIEAGGLFDFSAGYFVRERISVGIGVSRSSSSSDGVATGSVPHPIFFSRPRTFQSPFAVKRSELGVHLSVGYTVPVGDNLEVMLYGGPSSFRLKQDVVSDVTIGSEAAPFTSISGTPVITERSESVWGGHVGANVNYMFYRGESASFGAGMFLRYAGASADVQVMTSERSTDVGGFQVGGGITVKF